MMKKFLRSLCAVAALCCAALTGFGGLVDVDGFGLSWEVGQDLTIDNKRYAVITGVTGSAGGASLTIPASIQDYESGTSIPVREIGYRAFYDCKGLKELHVPDSVRVIGDEAFSGCKQLATLDLGQGVTSIGRFAFWYCPIGEINIPDSLVVPPNRLFDYCTAVTNLTIGSGLKVITTGILPSDGYSPCPALTALTIRGNGETEIADGVFRQTKVRFVTLEGVASIANSAFKDCPNLSQVTFICNSLTNIGEQAFAYCPSLQGFSIPDSVRTLGIEVLRESGLETVSLGAGVTNVPDRAFLNCRALTTVALPAQVKVLGSSAFENCTGLETIDLGTGVETLGGNVFYGCSQLGDVTVPEQVTSYGRSVFAGCSGLTNMTIAANVDVINNDLVAPYTGALETLTIRGGGSTVITEGTLSCMANLRHVTIGGVAEIQNSRSYVRGAFELCEKLESVTFGGNSLTNIGDYAFEDCKKITSLVFPDSVQRIAGFPGCSGLKTLEFGSGLVQLGSIRSCLPQAVRFAGGVPSGLSNSSFTDYGRPDALAMVVYAHDHAAEWEEWLAPFLAPGSYSKLPDTVRYVEEPAAGGEVISGSVTWSTDRVHVVSGWITLAEGATLTIEPGAIVKFRPGTGIYIRNGARCDARGALLTHIADDEVGGDTDGAKGVPVVGEYNIVPFGEYLTDDATFDRYRVKKLQVLAVRAYPRWPWNSYVDLEADIWSNDPGNTMTFRLSRSDGTEDRSLYGSTLKAGTNGYACVKVAGSADYNYIGKTAAYRVSANGMGGSRATTDILLDLAPVHYVTGPVELPYSTEWNKAGSVTVKAGDDVLVEKTAPASGTVGWTPETPGTIVLRHIAKNEDTATFRRLAAGTTLHRGVVSNDTCWAAGQVHVVNGRIDVLGDARLAIEPGAVVKFTDGSSINVADGSACEVKGVIFTHVADATVGGDTLEDGGATVPVANAYAFVGNVIEDESTEYRYGAPKALTGPITADRVLSAGVYKVEETVTVQEDVTLTLEPGTILKFDTGCGLRVSGTLSAKGTRASPIVFTSLKDDAFGGDTDGDQGWNKPAKGDWATISVTGGKADFEYVRILYGGNDGTETADQLYLDGNGRVSFRNSSMEHVFKYCAGLESGVWTMVNSYFRDFYTAFRHFAACTCVNSVFYDCSYLSNNGGQVFKNCIVAKYTEGLCWNGSCTFRYCGFYNFDEGAPQRPDVCGINGNFWDDPLFSDAEGGDFRLMAGSPCIDAAEAASAPERDYFGSPRMNTLREDKPGKPDGDGMYPDVGIFEAVGISAEPMPDLEILSVTAPSAIQPGEDMTVNYTVTNRGGAGVSGVIRDTVRLRGAEAALGGQLVTLAPIGIGYSLEAGAVGEFQATVKLPVLASGKWTVGVQVNTERDVIESTYANNSLWADAASDADLPPLGSGVTETTVAQAGKACYSLAGFADAGVVLKVTGGDSLAITAGGRSAVQVSPGVYFVEVPAFGADERRSITVENLGFSTTVKIETAEDALAIWSVSPDRVANGGEASVIVTGSGFASNQTFKVDGIDAAKVEMTGPMQALVTFDATRFEPGYPSVTVIAGEKSVRLDRAFEVYRPLTGPKLNCWVEKPVAVRDGRISVAHLCYANEGDSPMRMPVFAVICSDDKFPDTKIGISPDAVSDRWIALCGISATAPAGVLKAGESVRLPFYLMPKDGYLLDITRYDTPEAGDEQWFGACAENATRLNLRGRTVYDYNPTVFDFSELRRNYADNTNSPYAAASGYLLDPVTREALSGRSVALVDGTGRDYQTVTDENGYFQVTRVPDGTYHWAVGVTETLSGRSTNEVVIANQEDLNNCEVFATAAGRISGHVTGVNGMVLPGCLVILFDAYGAVAGSSEVDVCGRFQIDGLKDGAYTIRAQATGGYLQQQPVPVTIDPVHRREEIEFSLTEKGATLRGSVSPVVGSSAAAVTNGTVQAITDAGTRYETLVDENGEFLLEGMPAGGYCVRYYSGTMLSPNTRVELSEGSDVALALVASDRPLFVPTRSVGYGSCKTEFIFIDEERAKNVTGWKWDFDSDGTVDAHVRQPTHTYSALGTNTVTLVFMEDGMEKRSVYENCVRVEEPLETVYAANAIRIGANSGTLAVASVGDGTMELTGDPGPVPVEVGTVLSGTFAGEPFCCRVRSVKTSGGRYVLAVGPAGWEDLYEQFAEAVLLPVTQAPVLSPKKAKGLLGAGEPEGEAKIEVALGCDFSVDTTRNYNIEYVREKRNGHTYLKWAIVGVEKVDYSLNLKGSINAHLERSVQLVPSVKIVYPNGLTTEFELKAKLAVNFGASGQLGMSGSSTTTIRAGQEGYDGHYEWLPPHEFTTTAECGGDLEGYLNARASVEPSFKVRVFQVMSAGVSFPVYVQFETKAARNAPPSCGLSAGIDMAVEANLIDAEWGFLSCKIGTSGTIKGPSVNLLSWTGATPDFSVEPRGSVKKGQVCTFFNDSLPGKVNLFGWEEDAPVQCYEWDFGDGTRTITTDRDSWPTHSYGKEGTYKVTLRAKGALANPFKKWRSVRVRKKDDDPPPPPEPPYDPNFGPASGDSQKSCDPNEVVGPLGVGEKRYVKPGEWLTYTIFFENKAGFDIADAQEVFVTNALSACLDWSTFEMGEVAFGNNVDLDLDGCHCGMVETPYNKTTRNVRTEVKVDEKTGVVDWYMRIVDPDGLFNWPEDGSGFLPSNDETHRGEAHLTYRIRVRDDAPGDVQIDNAATIVFDMNDPITTDPSWWNTVGDVRQVTLSLGDETTTNLTLVVGQPFGELPVPAARTGYDFAGWYLTEKGDDEPVKAETIVPAELETLCPRWTPQQFAVDVDGAVSQHAYGTTVDLTTPASVTSGCTNLVCFGWVGTGDVPAAGTSNAVTFTVSQESTLRWLYETNYWVSATAAAGGHVTLKDAAGVALPTNELWAAAGTNLVAEATADVGSAFARWVDAETGAELGQRGALTLPVDRPWIVQAEFTNLMFAVRFELGEHGSRTGGGVLEQTVAWGGAAVAPTVAAADGYAFTGWSAAFDCVTQNLVVTAQWKALEPEPKVAPTVFDSFAAGPASEKGATYNGFLGDEALGGTFTLVVKKPKKGQTTAVATLTKVNPSTGKKEKVTGTVDVTTGVCADDLVGLRLNAKGVGGKLGGLAVQGAVDAAKAKDASALATVNAFNKQVYGLVFADAAGEKAYLTATFSTKGKVKVAGTYRGAKVSGSTVMSVGDRCAVPFVWSKKGVTVTFVLWFDKDKRTLDDVTGLGAGVTLVDKGLAGGPATTYPFALDETAVLASVPDAIAENFLPISIAFNGKKFDAGKAAKVSYKKGERSVDTPKGANVTGLKLTYSKGVIKGSFTVYAISPAGKLVKNKFTVAGVMVDGAIHAVGTNKNLKPIPVEVRK